MVGQSQLVGSQQTVDTGVAQVFGQSRQSGLHNRGFFGDQVVKLQTHFSVAGVSTEGLSHWDNNLGQRGSGQDEVSRLDNQGNGGHR